MSVVTRYAPSPTGALHIGGARTALFNWAFSRNTGGLFHIRIEDTDRERSTRAWEDIQLEALTWLGIDWDPVPGLGTPRQSERTKRYQEVVHGLLESGGAYRCTCTPEEVEAMRQKATAEGRTPRYDGHCRDLQLGAASERPFCVRLRVTENGQTRWNDLIAGPTGQSLDDVDDFVLLRSDATPIYHLAVVVDDHDMGVTHVMRGREHITSTPRQLLIYGALGWTPPAFAHVPLLVDTKGKKLSKRDDAASVQYYRDRGFTPEAVLNFVARLGWGHGDLETFSQAQFARLFTLEGVGSAPSQVHEDKLLWLNQHYIKTLPAEVLLRHLERFLTAEAGRPVPQDAGLARTVDLLRERSKTLVDLAKGARFYWADDIPIDPQAAAKHLTPETAPALRDLRAALEALPESDWNEAAIQRAFESVIAQRGIKLGALAQPTRVALVGEPMSPGIFDTLAVIGRARSLDRLDRAVARATGQD